MRRKNITILIVVVAAIVLAAIFLSPGRKGGAPVPASTTVPAPGDRLSDKNIAVPVEAVLAPGGGLERFFNIMGRDNQFSPNRIIVNQGDKVSITFSAVDKKYDFISPAFGLDKVLGKGETTELSFVASSTGSFGFHCGQDCGSLPSSWPAGTIVVVPK